MEPECNYLYTYISISVKCKLGNLLNTEALSAI